MGDSITITGNITEPEMRHLPSGVAVLSFKIGRSHRAFDQAQQKWVEKSTSWYSVSAFRSLAEHGYASLRRGDRVMVHGRLKLRQWENGSGSHGFAADIEADSLGHDLLFGTSTFAKNGGRGGGGGTSTSEAWATADSSTSGEQHSNEGSNVETERQLTLSGPAADSEDTPF